MGRIKRSLIFLVGLLVALVLGVNYALYDRGTV